MAGDHSENEYTKSGKLRKPSIALWCNWIIKAWDQIDPAASHLCKVLKNPEIPTNRYTINVRLILQQTFFFNCNE